MDAVKGFLKQMDERRTLTILDWIQLALLPWLVEADDEPWGRCPGMRPMRKWLFGRQ